ncbi:hypothetical protein JHJ32_13880 [Parapedobacter sp. ISTM3]|uniref:hypothetical protein n=1 Tax=Parapedobacter sp. ISTM3 TaxID=2800130 RepID=UPI001908FDF4|nr:hypothetical protein [Parapedobacter sp. ISTM3]MBK1441084.1 hypothetical protein [Parapedobacter sp. ISTM3]
MKKSDRLSVAGHENQLKIDKFAAMYRNAISFLFLALILYNATSAVWINGAFLLNRDYVVENLCEQRLSLDNECQGQCVLMKKLKESQERDSEHSTTKMQELQLVFTQNTWLFSLSAAVGVRTRMPIPADLGQRTDSFTLAIFRPPIS